LLTLSGHFFQSLSETPQDSAGRRQIEIALRWGRETAVLRDMPATGTLINTKVSIVVRTDRLISGRR